MKIRVRCAPCRGTGVAAEWSGEREWLISDCGDCRGTGNIEISVIDERKATRRKKPVYPVEY